MIMYDYLYKVMPTLSKEQVASDYVHFKQLYFDRYPDHAAQRMIEYYLSKTPSGMSDSISRHVKRVVSQR